MQRAFLVIEALIWLPYGLWCFVEPSHLVQSAGVAATTPTGTVEIRAMYGGLQLALGVFAAAAVVRPTLQRPVLFALAFLCAGLFTARLLAAVSVAELSAYTGVALVFEALSSAFAIGLLSRAPVERPA